MPPKHGAKGKMKNVNIVNIARMLTNTNVYLYSQLFTFHVGLIQPKEPPTQKSLQLKRASTLLTFKKVQENSPSIARV
jgi:hypothetical protein